MPRKGKKRRDLHRRRIAQRAREPAVNEAEAGDEEARPPALRSEAPSRRGPRRKTARRQTVPPWLLGLPVLAVAAIIGGIVLFAGSSSGDDESRPSPTPDPRVAGLTPERTIEIDAVGDASVNSFSPNTMSVAAGEVVEIKVTNVGSAAHNLRVSGDDGEYDTADDWVTTPRTLPPGSEGTIILKMDTPGSYPFHCDLHPRTQTGLLTVQP